MAERFINPLETQPLVNSGVQAPRLNHQYGATQKMGQDISNSLLKVYEESKVNLKNSYLSDYMKDINEFESKMQYDKSYYQDPTKMAELKERLATKQNEFKKMAEELEFFPEDMEDITSKTDTLNLRVDTAYKAKYTQWREQEIKEDFLANQLQKAQNDRTNMMLGYSKEAVDGLFNSIKSYEKGIDSDYLTEENAIKNSLGDRLDLITANVMSYANKGNALEVYNQMANMTFEEFREHYKDMIFKLKGKEYDFTDMEYEAFKRSIDDGIRKINARAKADELNSKVAAAEKLKYQTTFPVKAAWETLQLTKDESMASRPDSIILSSNYGNGTNFDYERDYKKNVETLDLMDKSGYRLITMDKEEYYNFADFSNKNIPAIDVYKQLALGFQEYALGLPWNISENIMNSRTNPEDFAMVTGARGTAAYLKFGATQELFDTIYTESNKQIILDNKKTKFNVVPSLELFERETIVDDSIMMSDVYTAGIYSPNIEDKFNTTMAGFIAGLEMNKENDVNMGRLCYDMKKVINDTALIMIYEQTDGVIPKNLLDDFSKKGRKLEKGSTFDILESNEKALIYKVIASDKKFIQELKSRTEPALKEMAAGVSVLDIGSGKFVVLPEKYVTKDTAKDIAYYIKTNRFTNNKGEEVSKKKIAVKGSLNGNECIFLYNNQPLYIDGKLAHFTFREGENK